MKPESETKLKLLQTAIDMIWESSYGSVSVDDICARAGVKKGSFYHAFKSKSDLAVAAFDRHFQDKRVLLDSIFSSQFLPLQRMEKFCQFLIKDQLEKYRTFGKMAGCPFCSLGCELSTQDENIRRKVEEISDFMGKYVESAVQELSDRGEIEPCNAEELAGEIYSYIAGALMQAKFENHPKHVENIGHGVKRLLGLKAQALALK